MSRNIPIGQAMGACVEYAAYFAFGAYVAWFRPRRLREQVQAGKISEEQRAAALKKFSPFFGYMVMIAAILFALSQFF
jgi:hypothetical protein